MKHLPYALFDMDGTLVDSMGYWRESPLKYARKRCPHLTEEMADAICHTYTYSGLRELLASYGLSMTVEELIHACEDIMTEHYRHDIEVKPGAIAILEELRAAGTRMGIITMTPHRDAEICLRKTGLDAYISFVLTPEDTSDGSGKEKPEIFGIAQNLLGCENPADCLFFEDSLYAASTAKRLGFYLVGVWDRWAECDEVRAIADEYLNLDEA